ncbi:cytochrome c oxidase cbb3-type subunit 1 [Flavobacterium swingsii]|jgi:cytochrome c oxidase cbb3-type subunit 1|uniref:Cytochrome c oxidase cbb3-type subunit 1 n=2 Tax=Flavobacterium swingsii TaxID=498292 RepID=A0A1I0WWK4_9FLAO|nr:cytochrome c oxidase cbb3-type subunit 1 [Flavobacterium swingsii]
MKLNKKIPIALLLMLLVSKPMFAQNATNMIAENNSIGMWILVIMLVIPIIVLIGSLYLNFREQLIKNKQWNNENQEQHFYDYLKNLDKNQIKQFIKLKSKKCSGNCKEKGNCNNNKSSILILFLISTSGLFAQNNFAAEKESFFSQPGIIITIVLMIVPILLGIVYAMIKSNNALKVYFNKNKMGEAENFAAFIEKSEDHDIEDMLVKRKESLDFTLTNEELSGTEKAEDTIGILHNVSDKHEVHFTALKKKAVHKPSLAPDISKLILWYFGCAVFWLVVGTGIGEYLGIKFVSPDADHISWLSFGRLRPVHTNIVFWGWASLAMIGLGYYVVPIVSNAKIYCIKWGWIALALTNMMVVLGSLCLMSGINNGGGEFREYIWPVMALFAVALILTLANFVMTVAQRTTKEIYIANWYIVSAIIFTIIVALTAYLPFWQDGVSETIVQGYFMHSGVGMWFTLYTLGLLYYFIPQQINKPIYAYSLGIMAFWTQIIFYTIIGTHHFVFAPLPWWLQTVAIVGSAGMIIPVVAATINFTMTFKGQWHKVSTSYTLPFFLVAVVYYFIVSIQGTAEAFKFTNLIWHFTDFTVAHAHLGFYGIITFALWGGFYVVIPRLTGKEPPQHLVGVHFWLAFIGLLFYTIPLSVGATLRGLMWMEGKPFIDSVVLMFDYWLWRAIGGSLMFVSHLVFAYNFYKMTSKEVEEIDVKAEAFKILKKQLQ